MKRRPRGWRLGAMASLAALVVVIAGASVGQSALGGADQSGVLVAGTTDTVTNIDPAGNYDFGSFTVTNLIYQQLMGFPNGPKLQPVLATRCFAVGGNRTWRCNLRRNVTFHDGSEFDSADVKHTFDRVVKINDPSGISSLLGNLKSTKTNGKYAVTFTLKSPQSTWPLILATGAGFIVPNTYPANKLQANNQPQIGTGPYTLSKYTAGQQAVFEPYDDFWGPQARNDGFILRQYSRSSTMKIGIERGDIDMAFQTFTPVELASLRRANGLTVHKGQGAVIRYLVLNVAREPFNNIAVRRALAYAFPRQAIATRVYRGDVKPLFSMPPAGLPGHIDAFASRYGRAPNLAAAKRALENAGLDTPFPIELWWTPTHYGDASADEFAEIKRGLERNGVFSVTLKSTEWAQYSDALGRQYNAFQLGWFPDYADVENYVVPFYRSDTFTANGYKSTRMENLIKASLAARNNDIRFGIYRQIQRLAAEDVPIVPYWQADMIAAARNNVRGVQSTLDASFIMRYWKISKS
jgi:peptide/nickel transport system substrate-binding protein